MSFLEDFINDDCNEPAQNKPEEYFTHMVKNGEILYMIAKKYHCKMNSITKLNPELSGKLCLEPGMELKIPVSA